MKWIEAKVEFDGTDIDRDTDVIAGVFYDLGLKGVVIDDPGLEPVGDGWGDAPVERPQHPAVTAFLPAGADGMARCERLQVQLKAAGERNRLVTRLRLREIDDEDWAESWKKFFKPVWISADMIVKPSWEPVATSADTIVIDIDPGMAFGTGGHATTLLSLRLIRAHLKKEDAFLDVGTGSGILAIGAAKLGAGSVCAVDIDDTAVKVAADNFKRNGLPEACCRVWRGHLGTAVRAPFDLVAANILTDTVLELLEGLHHLLRPGGVFICSGIVSGHKDRVISALERHGFVILAVDTLENWIGIAARRRE
ncbi:MAG: 50S ribosomal protein L11 methyltransferase [Desulfobacterales bacterium]